MKKLLVVIALSVFSFGSVFAQKSEIGAFVGTSFYIGDLSHSTIFSECGFSCGVLYRYNFTPRWALKANILFAKVHASDAVSNGSYERNLSFKSPITELSVQAEVNFLRLYNRKGYNCFSPYVFAGVAVFSFNPQAELNGKTYDLQPLGTEGQGLIEGKKAYSLCSSSMNSTAPLYSSGPANRCVSFLLSVSERSDSELSTLCIDTLSPVTIFFTILS